MDNHELNLLQQESEKPIEQIDEELVREIWITLEQRKPEPLEKNAAAEAAAEKYRAGCKKSPDRKRKTWAQVFVIAAALCLLLTAIPRATGESLLVEFLQKVRADVVAFFHPDDGDNRHIPNNAIEHPGLEELRQEVLKHGVTVPVVPTWIPEGYELIELQSKEYPSKAKIVASFECNNQAIVFYYDIYVQSVTHEYIKDDIEYEKVEVAGIKHYIYTNNETHFALWDRDNVKCSIVVDCQEENLVTILNSIYNMEDQ